MTALTSKQRQDARYARLEKAAKENGFTSWSAMLTVLADGSHIVVNKKEYQDMKDIYDIEKVRAWSKSYLKEKKKIDSNLPH